MENKFKNILIFVAIVIAGLLIAGAIIYINQKKITKSQEILSSQQVGEKVINFINENILKGQTTASLVRVVEENGLYKVIIKIQDQEIPTYATPNGKILFTQAPIDLESKPSTPTTGEIPKTEKPDVKLFVMSYCPYGLQMQKTFLPVYDLLKDKTEMGIYFVNYIMHEKEEIDENLRQYCIQKEEKEKYGTYFSCFVRDGDFEKCLSEANIDRTKLATCVSDTDTQYNITTQYNDKSTWLNGRFPKFNVHSDLNQVYGVQGSPTVVINDVVVEVSPRSPEKFKEIICQAFASQPPECSQTLSNDVPSSGLGEGTGSSNGGSCQ